MCVEHQVQPYGDDDAAPLRRLLAMRPLFKKYAFMYHAAAAPAAAPLQPVGSPFADAGGSLSSSGGANAGAGGSAAAAAVSTGEEPPLGLCESLAGICLDLIDVLTKVWGWEAGFLGV